MNRKTTWRVFRDGEWGPATAQDDAKEAKKIRNLADTLDVMNDHYWTPWQALGWIIHHDVDRVRECSEDWQRIGPLFPVEGAPLGPFRKIWREIGVNYDVSKAWGGLWRAFESGKVRTAGIDAADGKPREINPLEWLGIEYLGIDPAELQPYRKGLQWRFEDLDKNSPAFREVLVRVADVRLAFPTKPPVSDSPARKRGPRPAKMPRLLELMREMDPKELLDMKQEEMAATFGAAGSTCRDARKEVLANYRQLSPIAK